MDLAAIIEIHEPGDVLWRRIKREYKRVGTWRFLDVLAFRLYSRLALARLDREWEQNLLRSLESRYPDPPPTTRILQTASPNSKETEQLLKELRPDIIVARCKNILSARIFKQASVGTFVMHPGICPEYRNAHGCFWALALRDTGNVGMTLLKIDEGVDTGPVYGYFRCNYDELHDTHNMIQNSVVFENLDALRIRFEQILAGAADTIDTAGRRSQVWGQPWLTQYWRWKRLARASR
jgi:methionyl-tRNA formyltransferase